MKLITLPHKACGLTCMINGLEDLYEQKTGIRLPDYMLLYISGLLGFVYLKNKNAPTQRMVFWGMQIAKYQYEALADVVGFKWRMTTNRSFKYTINQAKASIDKDTPAILGALDMYHLPYYDKFYHKIHIPIHHVMLVGYDDAKGIVLVLDCDRPDVQKISYSDLEEAWNISIPGLGKKNTFYTFTLNENVADVETIARKGLAKRASDMLNPPASMFGLKGMRKLAIELPSWPNKLDAKQLDISLRHLVEFTGFPPVPPNRLTGYDAPDNHGGGRDVFASMLNGLSKRFNEPMWGKSADLFSASAKELENLTNVVVDVLLRKAHSLDTAKSVLNKIADIEEIAFGMLINSKRV